MQKVIEEALEDAEKVWDTETWATQGSPAEAVTEALKAEQEFEENLKKREAEALAGSEAGAVSGPSSSDARAASSDAGATSSHAGASSEDTGVVSSNAGAASSGSAATTSDAEAKPEAVDLVQVTVEGSLLCFPAGWWYDAWCCWCPCHNICQELENTELEQIHAVDLAKQMAHSRHAHRGSGSHFGQHSAKKLHSHHPQQANSKHETGGTQLIQATHGWCPGWSFWLWPVYTWCCLNTLGACGEEELMQQKIHRLKSNETALNEVYLLATGEAQSEDTVLASLTNVDARTKDRTHNRAAVGWDCG